MTDQPTLPKASLLIVDDDPIVLRLLGTVLAREYEVRTFENPTEAVREVQARPPDVIICDIRMPEHDGFWVIAEVRKIAPLVPVILHSAYQDTYSNDEVTSVFKPFAYLTKGSSLREIRAMVAAAVLKSRSADR